MEKDILQFHQICKSFPGVRALNDVTFSLREGEVLALLGENGAGKSTLVKCLTGAQRPDSGEIVLFGKTYPFMDPREAREQGVSAVYQEFNLVVDLPVVENVFMGNLPGNGILVDYPQMLERCKQIFEDFHVDINPTQKVRDLSPAMMQIVEIVKAVALNCRILVLDEPTAPLTVSETETLFRIIRDAKKRGVSVIYISHRLEEIFEICDRAVVMRDGEYVDEREIDQTNRAELIKLMIGHELSEYYPEHTANPGDVVMSVRNLSGNGCKNVSFDLRRGEILGLAGLVGAGRTELLSVLFRDVPKESGSITINGVECTGKHPWDAIEEGLSLLPEDRKMKGLLLDKSVAANLTLASIKKLCNYGVIDRAKEAQLIDEYIQQLSVKTPNAEKEVQFLSGGNQQKVIVAKWLACDTDVIMFDEPTRGIDVGTKHEIYEIIDRLADEGKAILMVSSEFDELIGVADRILVMSEGELVGSLEKEQYNKERILDMASGKR